MAISCARRFFLPVIGNHAPALTVASFATTIHCLPETYPITTTTPAPGHPPCSLYIPCPAMAPISTRSVFGSSNKSMRSRAVSLPDSCSFSMRFLPPPRYIFSNSCCKFRIRSRIRSSLKLNSNSLFEIAMGIF